MSKCPREGIRVAYNPVLIFSLLLAGVLTARAANEAIFANATAELSAASWPDRLNGVYTLQRMGAEAAPAAPQLFAALDDENGLVRVEAAEALKRIGGPAVPLLVSGLSSSSEEVRRASAETLGRIGLDAEEALPSLRAAQRDGSHDVRAAAALAESVVAPEGAAGWARKLIFEVRDEPEGPYYLLFGFLGLVGMAIARQLWRSREAISGPGEAGPSSQADGVADAEEGDEEEGAADDDQDEVDEVEADGRAERSGGAKDRLPPPQGLQHAGAGLASFLVGAFVAVLGFFRDDLDERHATYLFASLWMWFGWVFARVGIAGWWSDRRSRARLEDQRVTEPWLRDRAWRRDGAGPIEEERVLPNIVPLLLWTAYLVPFHTVWRVSSAWWGLWIVIAVFDLIALGLLYFTLLRVWRALRAGRRFLRWQGVPVRPGGTFAARFESSRSLGAGVQAEVTLRCLRDRADNRRIGDEPAADAEEIWAETKSVPIHARSEGGSWAQLSFAVPVRGRGTDSYAARPIRWVVRVRVPTAGPDFETSFPAPIYR